MRLLIASSVYPPAIGGPSPQARSIAQAMVGVGWEVHVLTPRLAGRRIPDPGVVLHEIEWPTGSHWLTRNAALMERIKAVVGSLQPDLIHAQTCEGPFPLYVGWAARSQSIPSLVKFSADMVWNKLNRDAYQGLDYQRIHGADPRAAALTAMQGLTFRQFGLVWATSLFQANALRSVYHIEEKRIASLPNLIDVTEAPQRTTAGGPELVALAVTRVVPWKGLDTAIEALAAVPGPIVLRIVGGGAEPYLQQLRALARSRGVADRVEFKGSVAPDRVMDELAAGDIFLQPSRYEPFGIAIVEAMAAGLPVVASDVGGIPDIVEDGVSGLLVPPGDTDALARALQTLVTNAPLRRQMAQAARRRWLAFSLRHRLEDLIAVYRRCLELGGVY